MRRPVGVKWIGSFFLLDKVFSPAQSPLSPPFHPHSSLSDFVRSVQVGCSRFSRCCHLIVDLCFHPDDGSWARRLTQSPELGVWAFALRFCFCSSFLRLLLTYAAAGIALWWLLRSGS
jgi:hypothetical protein